MESELWSQSEVFVCDALEMDMVNPQPLQVRPYRDGEDRYMQIPMQVEGNSVCGDVAGGGNEWINGVDEATSSAGMAASRNSALAFRTSELTIAFEGEVYVFPAVTPDKVGFLDF